MMTVSDDGERTCPLCAEEMDLTDQQLKPCRCGYQICVWCWHHIIDLAEKDETIGRCPACRTPYDKERIVAMASDCERVVAEMNVEKKQKASKVKSKASAEAKKHLTSARVIQKNLVYIIGLPPHLCNERILEQKEYFGQYGKVLKVSVSRPTGSQQTSTNTFGVYITYSREEEAVRCIQSVHNYVLEGKALRACFGTTKYCRAWLRNMTCNNPDCLYLHDVGSHEDSFTKDEIISAYTRTGVPQTALSNSQRRSGSVLPPSLDDGFAHGAGSVKIQSKVNSNGAANQTRSSPPNNSVGKSAVLPAAASWGLRALNSRPLVPSSATPVKSKAETNNNSSLTSSLENGKLSSTGNDEVLTTSEMSNSSSSSKKSSAWHDEISKAPKILKNKSSNPNRSTSHDSVDVASKAPRIRTSSVDRASLSTSLMESSKISSEWHGDEAASTSKEIENNEKCEVLTSKLEPLKLGFSKDCKVAVPFNEVSENDFGLASSAWDDDIVTSSNQGEETVTKHVDDKLDPPTLVVDGKNLASTSALSKSDLPCSFRASICLTSHTSITPDDSSQNTIPDEKIVLTNNHLTKGDKGASKVCSEVSQSYNSANGVMHSMSLGLSSACLNSSDEVVQLNVYQHQPLDTDIDANQMSRSKSSGSTSDLLSRSLPLSVRMEGSKLNSESPKMELFSTISGRTGPILPSNNNISRLSDSVEHSSASSWGNDLGSKDPSLIPTNTDWKLESSLSPADKEILLSKGHKEGELRSSVSGKVFEFPEERLIEKFGLEGRDINVAERSNGLEMMGETNIISDILSLDFDPWDDSYSSNDLVKMLGEERKEDGVLKLSNSWKSQNSNQSRFSFAWQENQNLCKPLINDKNHITQNAHGEKFQTAPTVTNFECPKPAITTSNLLSQSDNLVGALRSKISAPPGFSTPIKPIPGFSTQDRFSQAYDSTYTENSFLGGSEVGAQYQSHLSGSSCDFELSDPAIMMAVGKDQMPLNINPGLDLKPTFPTHLSTSDHDPRLHLLMQQSMSSHQSMRLPEHIGDRYLSVNDPFIAAQLLAQNHHSLSPFDQMSVQQPINSLFSNGQWNGWNGFRAGGSDIHLGEILRTDRYGLTNFYSGNDELKFQMPSGNIYNRAFGM